MKASPTESTCSPIHRSCNRFLENWKRSYCGISSEERRRRGEGTEKQIDGFEFGLSRVVA